jgi:hypothetical protein
VRLYAGRRIVTRRRAGRVAAVLLLLATIAFGIGIAIEKAEEGEGGAAHAEETLLGIEVESPAIIALGLVLSLVAIAAVLRAPERPWVVEAVAVFCAGFAVLDAIEVGRKWGDETTIALLALVAALLHLAAAAVLAAAAARRPAAGATLPD